MADDDLASPTVTIGSLKILPFDEQRRRALMLGQVTVRKFIFNVLGGAIAGVLIAFGIQVFGIHPGSTWSWGFVIVVAAFFALVFLCYSIQRRRATSKDLRSGTYACYSGPLRLQVYVSSSNHGRNDEKTYKLVLGTYTQIQVSGDTLKRLQQQLPAQGQADFTQQSQVLLEIRNENGASIFSSAALNSARENLAR